MIGDQAFLKKQVLMAAGKIKQAAQRSTRRSSACALGETFQLVAEGYEVDPSGHAGSRSSAPGHEVAALRCRRLTSSMLAELSKPDGLKHSDSAANLVQRANKQMASEPEYKKKFEA